MANIELLAEITASGMYIFDYFTKEFFGCSPVACSNSTAPFLVCKRIGSRYIHKDNPEKVLSTKDWRAPMIVKRYEKRGSPGKSFLIDPMLADNEAYPGFDGTVNSHLRIPLIGLPVDMKTITDVDAIIATHLHPDHWDMAATEKLPKEKPVYVQDAQDAHYLTENGFSDVCIMEEENQADGVVWNKTACQHGSNDIIADSVMGPIVGNASGLFFHSEGEKSVYFVGDTIWTQEVENNLKTLQPDVVVVNAEYAQVIGFGSIIFGKEDVLRVHRAVPHAQIVAIHMEAVNHCILSRKELQEYAESHLFSSSLHVPSDGEVICF